MVSGATAISARDTGNRRRSPPTRASRCAIPRSAPASSRSPIQVIARAERLLQYAKELDEISLSDALLLLEAMKREVDHETTVQ
jgi:hypothetical protein